MFKDILLLTWDSISLWVKCGIVFLCLAPLSPFFAGFVGMALFSSVVFIAPYFLAIVSAYLTFSGKGNFFITLAVVMYANYLLHLPKLSPFHNDYYFLTDMPIIYKALMQPITMYVLIYLLLYFSSVYKSGHVFQILAYLSTAMFIYVSLFVFSHTSGKLLMIDRFFTYQAKDIVTENLKIYNGKVVDSKVGTPFTGVINVYQKVPKIFAWLQVNIAKYYYIDGKFYGDSRLSWYSEFMGFDNVTAWQYDENAKVLQHKDYEKTVRDLIFTHEVIAYKAYDDEIIIGVDQGEGNIQKYKLVLNANGVIHDIHIEGHDEHLLFSSLGAPMKHIYSEDVSSAYNVDDYIMSDFHVLKELKQYEDLSEYNPKRMVAVPYPDRWVDGYHPIDNILRVYGLPYELNFLIRSNKIEQVNDYMIFSHFDDEDYQFFIDAFENATLKTTLFDNRGWIYDDMFIVLLREDDENFAQLSYADGKMFLVTSGIYYYDLNLNDEQLARFETFYDKYADTGEME